MKKLCSIIVTALLATSAQALTLEEALTSSYNHNEELQINKTDFLTNIEKFPQALANFMPRVSIHSNINAAKVTRTSSVPSIRDTISKDNNTYNNAIIAEQSLFNGWSSVSNLKAAQAGFRAAKSGFYEKEQQILFKDIEKYLNVITSQEKHHIAKLSVKSNNTQLRAMQEKFKQGESTASDVESARASLATAESNEAVAFANYEIAKSSFVETVGIPAENLEMPTIPEDLITDLDELIASAIKHNLSLESIRHQITEAKSSVDSVKGQLLPKVNLKVEAGKTKYAPQSIDTNTINHRDVASTLGITIPILAKGGAEYSDIRRANYQHKKTILSLDASLKQIKSNCISAISGFEAAKKRILATKQAVKSAEIAYDGMTQEEKLGSKTIIDVLSAEDRLNAARESFVDAKRNLILSAYQIKSLTGDLTAKSFNLKVNYFDPDQEFRRLKFKIVSF